MEKGKPLDPIRLEADHFMVCPVCGVRFDMRRLDQVAEHVHDGDFPITNKKSPTTN